MKWLRDLLEELRRKTAPTTCMATRFDETADRVQVCIHLLRAHRLDSEVLKDAVTVLRGNAGRIRYEERRDVLVDEQTRERSGEW